MKKNKLFNRSKKLGKLTLALASIFVAVIAVSAGYYMFAIRAEQDFNITTMGDLVTINGLPLGTEIIETINLVANQTNISTYMIVNNANEGFNINVSTTFDVEGIVVEGTGIHYINPMSTTYVNISYTPDLWINTTRATATLTFELL